MNTSNLAFGLMITCVVLLIIAIATPNWGCGNLLSDCSRHGGLIASKVFFMLGIVCCAIVLVLEIMGFASLTYRSNGTINLLRLIFLGIGVGSLVLCILIFTGTYMHHWSYMCAVIAMVCAIQVLIIGLMSSSCVVTSSSTVVRQTVVVTK